MRPEVQIFLSGCLTFGVPLVLAIRELVLLRRHDGDDWPRDRPPEDTPKPLPPCLLVPFQTSPPPAETRRRPVPELV
jgi:hypothetical protein